MKTNLPLPVCTVQSVTDATGRRVVTFTRISPQSPVARPVIKRRKAPFKATLILAPQADFSFEPVIQVRSQVKP